MIGLHDQRDLMVAPAYKLIPGVRGTAANVVGSATIHAHNLIACLDTLQICRTAGSHLESTNVLRK